MPDYLQQRLNMVAAQVRTNDVTDLRIQQAMREVPRERFVPAAQQALAYADAPVEVARGRYLLDPRTFAKLLQLADVVENDSVLDVGCATGYSTAVIARLARKVTGLEQDADLLRVAVNTLGALALPNAAIVQGPLAEGCKSGGLYNVIFVNGSVEEEPRALLAQLAEGGRLAVIFQPGAQGHARLYVREHGRVGARPDFDATVPRLVGFKKSVGFVF